MITVINAETKPWTSIAEGRVRRILAPSEDGTRVHVAIEEVDRGKSCRLAPGDRTQIVYILEGKDATVTHTRAGDTAEYAAQRRTGVYLEPSESASVTASGGPLTLLLLTVPKHTGKPTGSEPPVGYFFEEAQLRALVDEKRIRERTFWVNKETGLSGSWDLQLGRMYYAPNGYSPRHVHHQSKTSADHAGALLLHRIGHGRSEARQRHDSGWSREHGAHPGRRMASADRVRDRARLHRIPGALRLRDDDGPRSPREELVHQGNRRRNGQLQLWVQS